MSKNPEFTITTVGECIAKMKQCDQRTLTQMLGVESKNEYYENNSDSDFEDKRPARFATVSPSPAKVPVKK